MPVTTNMTRESNRIFFRLYCCVCVLAIVALFVYGQQEEAAFYAVGLILIWLIITGIKKCIQKRRNPTSNWRPPLDQTPVSTISLSVNHATPSPRLTPSEATTNHPLSESPLTLSSQFSHHASRFSSPRNVSQTPVTSSTVHMYAPSAPGYRGRTDVEAATVLAANQPPPAYPEVVGGDSGLLLRPYTIPATDEIPGKVSEACNDGLPSYEAAMSTRQPPAYEAPRTPRNDGPTTND